MSIASALVHALTERGRAAPRKRARDPPPFMESYRHPVHSISLTVPFVAWLIHAGK